MVHAPRKEPMSRLTRAERQMARHLCISTTDVRVSKAERATPPRDPLTHEERYFATMLSLTDEQALSARQLRSAR